MYQQLRATVEDDFVEVNQFIIDQLHSEVGLVESIGHYIVDAGGKRLRPLLTLLAARSCGIAGREHIPMAAVIEFIHTATLLHDDVVDMSTLRRGRPTVNAQWSNPSSVLVGDFIYSRAFQILVQIGHMGVMEIMADTTNKIAEGEVLQLISKSSPDTDEATYHQVIQSKTAILFQAAAQCGAILAGAEPGTESALRRYGMHLGTAFQLIDDVLDYAGDAEVMGKNLGDDLAEGKPTLPLIRSLAQANAKDAALIRSCLSDEEIEPERLQRVIELVQAGDALDYSRAQAEEQAAKAKACLNQVPESRYRDTLAALVEFSLQRTS